MTGAKRYLVGNLTDPEKQLSIQLLKGSHQAQKMYGMRYKLNQRLAQQVGAYMSCEEVRVGCLTWNCAGN